MNRVSAASPMRVWLLSFPLPGPSVSLALFRAVCGFRLNECYSVRGRHCAYILLHFSLGAGVTRMEIERSLRRLQNGATRRGRMRCFGGHSAADVRLHPGFKLLRSRMLDGDKRLRCWRAAHYRMGAGLIGRHRLCKRPASAPVLRGAANAVARARLAVESIQCSVVVLKCSRKRLACGKVVEWKEAKMLKTFPKPPPSPSILAAIVKARPFTPPRSPPPKTVVPVLPHPTPTPLRAAGPSTPSYQYVERANDRKWATGWAC